MHNTYADAVYAGVGINTIALTVDSTAGVVTFRQLDVNYSETNATVVYSSAKQSDGSDGSTAIYFDGVDVPSDGTFQITYDYDSNSQRNRIPGDADNTGGNFDPRLKIVAVGLQTGQFAQATATLTRTKSQSITVTGPLERVYSDPALSLIHISEPTRRS